MRDLGSLGQFIFGAWCSSVGLTANGSQIDKTGWDFFVEFPLKQEDKLPKDMLPAPRECKIQVKSTDKRERKLSITVSNLNRLVKAQMPTFFCFIEFDGKNEAQSAYLVHVGREIIEKTLKRIRELENKGYENKLNKHKITIHYGNNDRLADTTGESLKSAIESHIPNGIEKYIGYKNELVNTLGFENGIGQFNFMVSGNDPIRDMVDLTLGIRQEINIDNCISYHSRFEILSNNPFHNSEKAILSIQPKPINAILKFKEYEFSPSVSFNAKFYNSPLNRFFPEEYVKCRIESSFFDFVIEPFNNKAECSFCFGNDEQSPLHQLRDFLKVLVIFSKASNEVIVEIEIESKDLDRIPLQITKISTSNPVDDPLRIYQIAEMAVSICHQFRISESSVLSTIDELVNFSSSIELFHKVLDGDPKTATVDFHAEGERYEQGTKAVCTFFIKTVIGNHIIGCCLGIAGSLTLISEKRYRLIADKFLRGRQLVAIDKEIIDQEVIDRELDKFEEELQNEEIVTIRRISVNC